MERRDFLSMLGAGVASAALGLTGVEFGPRVVGMNGFLTGTGALAASGEGNLPPQNLASDSLAAQAGAATSRMEPGLIKPEIIQRKLPSGTISTLKGEKNLMALTVDDGVSSVTVREYAKFAQRTGMRLTFFITGCYASWSENVDVIRPLVENGQIQLGNHTWTHPDLKTLSDGGIVDEMNRTQKFITNTFGVDPRPFFRPPYGNHDARVDKVAASIGYSTPVMWDGSLSDSGLITVSQLRGFADSYIQPERIVIGHANYPTVTECFDFIQQLIVSRKITPVTLNDVYAV